MSREKLRIVAGVAALLVLLLVAVRLLPAYWRNQEFQRALEDVSREALASNLADEAVRVTVVNAAARLGVPLRFDGVSLKRTQGRLEVQALYIVPVELPLYSVDLHFRTRARVP